MAKTQLSQTFAGQVSCEKVEIKVSRVDNVVIRLVILNTVEIETQTSLLGQMTNHFQIARTVEPSWWLNGLDNFVSFLNDQICVNIQSARILSRIFDVLLMMRTSQFLLLSLTRFIQHAQLILKNFVVLSWKIRNPVHPSQISDWESLTQLVSSASQAQTGGQITRV